MMWWTIGMVFAGANQEEAEIQRLREQLNRYQESGAVEYSERIYLQMLELDPKNRWMTDGDHILGAMASNARGDLAVTLERLERCQTLERAIQWRTYIWDNTGTVEIPAIQGAELTIMMGLMNPEQIAAIEFANQQLKNNKVYTGRLPNGAYQYGSYQFLVSSAGLTPAGEYRPEVSSTKFALAFQYGGRFGIGAMHLGEGQIIETAQVLDARGYPIFEVAPMVTVWMGLGYLKGYGGLRLGTSSETKMTSGMFGVQAGKVFENLTVGGGIETTVARLSFPMESYIKRSVGYSAVLHCGYDFGLPIDPVVELKTGILGSHVVQNLLISGEYTF